MVNDTILQVFEIVNDLNNVISQNPQIANTVFFMRYRSQIFVHTSSHVYRNSHLYAIVASATICNNRLLSNRTLKFRGRGGPVLWI